MNGDAATLVEDHGFVRLHRKWESGDSIELDLAVPPRLVQSHPKNSANYEKLAIARGPLIYCLEHADNPSIDIFSTVLPVDIELTERRGHPELGDVVTLSGDALIRNDNESDGNPYRTYDPKHAAEYSTLQITAIPYFSWANRGRHSMLTAMPYLRRS